MPYENSPAPCRGGETDGGCRLIRKLKTCGCLSSQECIDCGRVDLFAADYHRERCKQYKG